MPWFLTRGTDALASGNAVPFRGRSGRSAVCDLERAGITAGTRQALPSKKSTPVPLKWLSLSLQGFLGQSRGGTYLDMPSCISKPVSQLASGSSDRARAMPQGLCTCRSLYLYPHP